MCQDDQQATPIDSSVTNPGPMPSLPPGFNQDGSRQTDLSSILEDHVHPDIGPIPSPPPPPPTSSVDLSHEQMMSHDQPMMSHDQPLQDQRMSDDQPMMSHNHMYNVPYGTQVSDNPLIMDLTHRLKMLEHNLMERDEQLKEAYHQLAEREGRIADLENEVSRQNEEKEALMRENNHYKLTCRRLDSFIQQLRGSGGQLHTNTSPSISPNRMHPSLMHPAHPNRRVTDPHFDLSPDTQHYHHHRASDPGVSLQVPNGSLQRPNRLYLGKTMAGQQQQDSSPYENGTEYRTHSWQKQSPSSDTSKDGHIKTMNSSFDDLSDRSSYESYDTSLSGANAKGTVV